METTRSHDGGVDGPSDSLAVLDPFPGEYRFRSLLGRGSFGAVWLADDLNLGVPVALKTLHVTNSALLESLRGEARVMAGLSHPNIVRVFAWRQAGGEHYLVMQYVAGGSLADRLARAGPLPWASAARYVADVGEALVRVHAAGLVHRDIKPANVLWDAAADEAVLTDFGLSARLANGGPAAGTPAYMAPEAFAGRVAPAGDVYGLAATLFALVTGGAPFVTARWSDLPAQIACGLPDNDPRCAGLPEAVELEVRAGLAADPERRTTLAAFVAGLRGALNQSLADALPRSAGASGVRLTVGRWDGSGFAPLAAVAPRAVATRDLQRVPAPPASVGLRTGDRVRVQVAADRPGHLTVFNVGPTGNLNPLHAGEWPAGAQRPVDVLDAELTPPAGRERLFAVWSRSPLTLSPADMRGLAGRDDGPSRPYRATRDLQVLRESVSSLGPDDCQAVVIELDHRPH